MNLSDLLSELRNNILHDRATPYLWSDATLVRYINEAQRRFAIKGLVIRDSSTAEVVNLTLVAGQTQYTLHSSIIAVISAKVSTLQNDLVRTGHFVLGGYNADNRITWDSTVDTVAPGPPLAYSTDEQVVEGDSGTVNAVSMRVYPVPSVAAAGTVINLRVVRKPIDDFTTANLGAVPEIPEEHHLEMLDWAAYLALRIVDQDAGSPKRADEFAGAFEVHVIEARKLVMRKLFAPKSWGFGRGGWSWEA